MTDAFRVGLVQMNAGNEVAPNIEAASAYIREAAANGATLVLTPEMTTLLDTRSKPMLGNSVGEADDQGLAAFRALAAELKIHLLIGSLSIWISESKIANRTYLIGPNGNIMTTYDKIHLFDVDLAGGESYRESELYAGGDVARVADLPWGRIGLSICYDLRFPYLYRALADAGAGFLAVPAAFTQQTGEAHWHILLRARAIENGCFVFAPAQTGLHANGRRTYGHSLVVDPWGQVLADGGTEPGIVLADVDPSAIERARSRVPSLQHTRTIEVE